MTLGCMPKLNETLTLSIHLPEIYSESIRMAYRLEKHVHIVVKRIVVVKTDGVELPADHIADVQISCKYLGIPQTPRNHKEKMRKAATSKCHKRIRQGLMSQLNQRSPQQIYSASYQIPTMFPRKQESYFLLNPEIMG